MVAEAHRFEAKGVKREHWRTATPIRMIFKSAFAVVGLPYFNPHGFRKTLVALGERCCQTPEEFKAWSQNLGHEDVLTTFYTEFSVGTTPITAANLSFCRYRSEAEFIVYFWAMSRQ